MKVDTNKRAESCCSRRPPAQTGGGGGGAGGKWRQDDDEKGEWMRSGSVGGVGVNKARVSFHSPNKNLVSG